MEYECTRTDASYHSCAVAIVHNKKIGAISY